MNTTKSPSGFFLRLEVLENRDAPTSVNFNNSPNTNYNTDCNPQTVAIVIPSDPTDTTPQTPPTGPGSTSTPTPTPTGGNGNSGPSSNSGSNNPRSGTSSR